MKPHFLKLNNSFAQSFNIRRDITPFFNNRWHYHDEVELIYLKKGKGTQFVGDNVRSFSGGDIVLIGGQLPHFWRFDQKNGQSSDALYADVIVAHFQDNCWGSEFLLMPELKLIRNLLERSRSGLQIQGAARTEVARCLGQMLQASPFSKLLLLIQALQIIAESNETEILSSTASNPGLQTFDDEKINAIYDYSLSNFRNKITLEGVAKAANLSPNSFCRFFKAHTGQTYLNFLLEYRIGTACKLLVENTLTIQQICYECGFNSLTGFYKYFKKRTGKTPQQYQLDFFNTNKFAAA